jgi:hypothetical protein
MPWSDIAVLIGVVFSTMYWMRMLRQRGVRGQRFVASGIVGFLGLVLIVTMAAHCLDVLTRLAIGRGYDGSVFGYDFRVYSLFLLGLVLIGVGVQLLRASLALCVSAPNATGLTLGRVGIVLVIVTPLIPIQAFFAISLTVLSGVTFILVVWLARQPNPDIAGVAAEEDTDPQLIVHQSGRAPPDEA